MVVIGLDSDGSDGPTDFAGGIGDNFSVGRARELGIDLFACLNSHDASTALKRLGDAILTGATGTNVNDLKLMIVLPGDKK